MRKENGITLIALVITIIILIILAGIVVNLSIGENGVFNKAKEAKEKYTVESIREEVEIGIMNLEINEIALGNQVTIELVLQELLEYDIFETIDKDTEIGNIGEYEVKLKYNEEGKVVIDYIEKATGVRITYKLNPESYTNGDKVSILLNVYGKVKSVTKPDGLVVYPENERIAINYQVTANGTYTFIIEDEEGNKNEKNVIVDTIDRLAPNEFEITAISTETGIQIIANALDAESDGISVKSGIEKYEYFVKGESDSDYIKYDVNEIEILEYGEYEIYVIVYDKAGNSKVSDTITYTLERTINSKRYVDYGIDLNADGDTTNDWMIFYEEEDETSKYYGATYIIPAYYVPYTKMQTSVENAGMKLVSGTYKVYWSSVPTYVEITDTVREIFMYDYEETENRNIKYISRLLDTSAWESDFVTEELKAKGGMAIGGPTINLWCASWNKEYPKEKVTPTIVDYGYEVNDSTSLNLTSYTGYKIDAPNIYFPAKKAASDGTYIYWLAAPSSLSAVGILRAGTGTIYWNSSCTNDMLGLRPVVYLPPSVTLEESGIPNLYNINYGD